MKVNSFGLFSSIIIDSILILSLWLGAGHSNEREYLTESISNFSFGNSIFDIFLFSLVKNSIIVILVNNFKKFIIQFARFLIVILLLISSIIYFCVKLGFVVNHADSDLKPYFISATSIGIVFSIVELILIIQIRKKLNIINNSLINAETNENISLLVTIDKPKETQTQVKYKLDRKRLWGMIADEKWLLIGGMVMLLIAAGTQLIIPALFGEVIEAVSLAEPDTKKFKEVILILVIVFIIGSLAMGIRAWLFTWAGQRIVSKLRKRLFAAIVRQEIGFFDANRTGELTNRLSSDTTVLQNALTVNISMVLRYAIQVLGAIIILFVYSWSLTLITLSIVPVVAIGAVVYGRYLKEQSKQFQDKLAKAASTAEEIISNMRTVRSFSREEKAAQQYGDDVESSYIIGKKIALLTGSFSGVIALLFQSAIIFVVYEGGTQVINGDLSVGSLTSFLFYTLVIAMSFALLASLYSEFMSAIGASQRVFELLDRQPEMQLSGHLQLNQQFNPKIEFIDVSFHYPSRKEVQVLSDINLMIEPGTILALVGPSGGGKSTIVALIERFYDPEKGNIKLDGNDIKDLDFDWYHRQIGFVSQEPILFACSIKENITFGCAGEIPMEQIELAAKEANAYDFIMSFPEGFNTVVGERGVRLSGGQKQRVAIARALVMNPKILLLDEATSALDAESEHLVQEAIDRAMQNRTVVVIAHRLSTVRNANKVIVINGGKIAEQGSHDELITRPDGIYRQLVKRQLAQ
eukprot:TRINITY_DN3903_c0_g2_i1.p1 TRINITY_DN3903_c0_g2~~TRINITY_DN3903_c0_g2_i1.p1  ORF type:complete len:750 (-),score=277.57 TRINITY_DN3903_c0_g2_i1:66-2315(-)